MTADKMKFILFIFLMFTLALGQFNDQPCQPAGPYVTFLKKHILPESFDRKKWTLKDWRKYLEDNNLCDRPRQTFMEKKDQEQVEQICQGQGWRFDLNSNLCISNSPIDVYDLKVDNNCRIKKDQGPRYVVVACDVIDRGVINHACRPVHFNTSMPKDNDKDKRTVKCSA